MQVATQNPLGEHYDSGTIVVESDHIIVIASTCLGIPMKQVIRNEQHLCCSRIESLDTVIWISRMKALKIPSEEEAMEATIQRKQVQDLNISNQYDIGLNVCHLYDNHHTSLKLLL